MDINADEVIGDVTALLPVLESLVKAVTDARDAAKAKDAVKTAAALEQAAQHLEQSLEIFDEDMGADRKKIDVEIAQLPSGGAPATTEPKP
jgi:hypothetical protein